MNIFVLSLDPRLAAQYLCNKHVVKMILESVQLLCTTHRCLGDDNVPYKSTHRNHPCAIWVRQSYANYLWLCQHLEALAEEYTLRYGRVHKSYLAYQDMTPLTTDVFPSSELTPFAQAMDQKYRDEDPVRAYRRYYLGEKKYMAKWPEGRIPEWWQ